MATRGGFAAWTERAKDVIVQELRAYISLEYSNVLREMPQIERYGLAGKTSSESFVHIYTTKPHIPQRLPFIAVMGAPGSERKMAIGRQVIQTFHHPVTGLPTIREVVGGDMNIVLEIATTDANTRSELTDIVFSFFSVYLESKNFSILGNTELEPSSGVPNLYQIIIKNQASLGGESDIPRPDGEPVSRIYMNRITVPIIFLDYVDREGFDISACYSTTVEKETAELPPISEPGARYIAYFDDFDTVSDIVPNWAMVKTPNITVDITEEQAIHVKSLRVVTDFDAVGTQHAFFHRRIGIFENSGRLMVQFRLTGETSRLVLSCMLQEQRGVESGGYHLVIPTRDTDLVRMELYRGSVFDETNKIADGSRVRVVEGLTLAAALEWKYDKKYKRIRIRGYVTKCGSKAFGELVKRLEYVDPNPVSVTSLGDGFGMISNSGSAYFDNIYIVNEFQVI